MAVNSRIFFINFVCHAGNKNVFTDGSVKTVYLYVLTGFDASHQEEILQLFGGSYEVFHHTS